jgi:hypothetical protein
LTSWFLARTVEKLLAAFHPGSAYFVALVRFGPGHPNHLPPALEGMVLEQ